jgi:uncharacterized membrane protein YfcA
MLSAQTPVDPPLEQAKLVLLGLLVVFAIAHAFQLVRRVLLVRKVEAGQGTAPGMPGDDSKITPFRLGIGFGTNFFDTLGIGSFATTTSIARFFKMMPDERIPGTLNVGHAIPAMTQAFIFTQVVPVEATTLISMILAAISGAWLGAGIVAGLPRRKVQIGMGVCLTGAALLMLASLFNLTPGGGEALALTGNKFAIGVGVNFILGILMTLGIGLYAPCLIAVSMLGMNPTAAFPIMMGSCAFLMPVAGMRFVQKGSLASGTSLALTLGGIPATLIAAYIVKSLPLNAVRWLVVIVVLYTAAGLLNTALRGRVAIDET